VARRAVRRQPSGALAAGVALSAAGAATPGAGGDGRRLQTRAACLHLPHRTAANRAFRAASQTRARRAHRACCRAFLFPHLHTALPCDGRGFYKQMVHAADDIIAVRMARSCCRAMPGGAPSATPRRTGACGTAPLLPPATPRPFLAPLPHAYKRSTSACYGAAAFRYARLRVAQRMTAHLLAAAVRILLAAFRITYCCGILRASRPAAAAHAAPYRLFA